MAVGEKTSTLKTPKFPTLSLGLERLFLRLGRIVCSPHALRTHHKVSPLADVKAVKPNVSL